MPKTLILNDLSDTLQEKMEKKKSDDGFKDRTWANYLSFLFEKLSLQPTAAQLAELMMRDRLLNLIIMQIGENLEDVRRGHHIMELIPEIPEQAPKGIALCIAKGPSVRRCGHIDLLADYVKSGKFKEPIIATASMIFDCLKRGIIPDYVVDVDSDKYLITKYFGDYEFEQTFPFATQDEIEKNYETMKLVNKYGNKMKAILVTSISHSVVERCKEAGIIIHFFNQFLDEKPVKEDDNVTRIGFGTITSILNDMQKSEINPKGIPVLTAGMNSGTCAWMFSHLVLRRNPVLIGFDFGHDAATPLQNTTYYNSLSEQFGIENVSIAYNIYNNPYFDVDVMGDVIHEEYKRIFGFLALVAESWIKTVQCSPGCLFFTSPELADKIEYMDFRKFMERYD